GLRGWAEAVPVSCARGRGFVLPNDSKRLRRCWGAATAAETIRPTTAATRAATTGAAAPEPMVSPARARTHPVVRYAAAISAGPTTPDSATPGQRAPRQPETAATNSPQIADRPTMRNGPDHQVDGG